MASFSPRCEIRQLARFVDPGGIKASDAERHVGFYGRRSLPVKKPRFIPAQLAQQLARKLQARGLGTVAGFEALGLRPLAPVGLRAPGLFPAGQHGAAERDASDARTQATGNKMHAADLTPP